MRTADTPVITDPDAYLGADLFSLDVLVKLLHTDHDLHAAFVAQTGGGTATVYAGPTTIDENGDARFAASVGPGTYGWSIHEDSTATLAEFYLGPDDDGQADSIDVVHLGVRTLRDVANLVAAQARTTYGELVDAETLDALGLDSSARSNLPEVAEAVARTGAIIEASNAALHEVYARGGSVDEAYRASTAAGKAAAADLPPVTGHVHHYVPRGSARACEWCGQAELTEVTR